MRRDNIVDIVEGQIPPLVRACNKIGTSRASKHVDIWLRPREEDTYVSILIPPTRRKPTTSGGDTAAPSPVRSITSCSTASFANVTNYSRAVLRRRLLYDIFLNPPPPGSAHSHCTKHSLISTAHVVFRGVCGDYLRVLIKLRYYLLTYSPSRNHPSLYKLILSYRLSGRFLILVHGTSYIACRFSFPEHFT